MFESVFFSVQFLGAPLQVGLLLLPDPWCFISHMISYLVAETFFGIAASVVIGLVPSDLTTSAMSIYFFSVQIIGGNMPIFVTPITDALSLKAAMLICFPGFYVVAGFLFLVDYILLRHNESKSYAQKDRDINETLDKAATVEQGKDNLALESDIHADTICNEHEDINNNTVLLRKGCKLPSVWCTSV